MITENAENTIIKLHSTPLDNNHSIAFSILANIGYQDQGVITEELTFIVDRRNEGYLQEIYENTLRKFSSKYIFDIRLQPTIKPSQYELEEALGAEHAPIERDLGGCLVDTLNATLYQGVPID